jgi:hypothetical protein
VHDVLAVMHGATATCRAFGSVVGVDRGARAFDATTTRAGRIMGDER